MRLQVIFSASLSAVPGRSFVVLVRIAFYIAMMEPAQKNPGAANLVNIPGFLLLGGGVPVRVGDDVIGAVGVGGASGGHLDEQCVMAALDKVKDQLR